MEKIAGNSVSKLEVAVALALIVLLFLELAFSIRRETQTWDEGCHIFAGYSYWTGGDFGVNPEHPPLLKLLATLPLLSMQLKVPPHPKIFSKEEDFTTAAQFIYANDARAIFWRTRITASSLTLLLATAVFIAARRMFGKIAAFTALILFVLEPTVLAHGALVTTDMALSCFLFLTVLLFYAYVQRPTAWMLLLTSVGAGFALAVKHSGILLFPILALLCLLDLLLGRKEANLARRAVRHVGALATISIIAVAVLWSSYGFHLHPRAGLNAQAQVEQYASRLHHPLQLKMIAAANRWHLLPEPYLYGLADVGFTADFSHTYLLGKVYPHGLWYYFPVAFAIKASLALILLLIAAVFALRSWRAYTRELLFIVVPIVIYLAVAMSSRMNIGVRHILPIFPFLIILAAWGASELVRRGKAWAYVVVVLMIFDATSSFRAFPVYIPYANELWGGPANTYKYLTDSNADWGQQLNSVREYLNERHLKNCWFAYFADVVVDPAYYGVPCKPLTTIASVWLQHSIDVPPSVDGPVLISAGVLSGYEFGPDVLNPYEQFQRMKPTAVIEHGVFIYDGHFDIPLASALNHVTQSQLQEAQGNQDGALSEARMAVALAPESVRTQSRLGYLLLATNHDEAREHLQKALTLAKTVHPEFADEWTIPGLKHALGQ